MSDAIDPRSQRTSGFKLFEAAPEAKVNFLEKVAPFIRIEFISSDEPVQRIPKIYCCLAVEVVLILAHTLDSR